MSEDKIEAALKEIGYGEVRVIVADGVIIALPKQIIQRPEKAGVKTQHTIDEEIKR